ncbi:MAG: MarR family transcriptional regulator [Propionibacteriaceae bacterium]|nr:MarR family transcriptional regulator [Propionibacteriaceae bacterium]
MEHRYDLEALGLDAERSALAREIWELNLQVHEQAMRLVGPSQIPLDLTVQQLRVLNLVASEPGLSSQDLARQLAVSPPTASGLVDRLEEKGVLERRRDPDDRRLRRLYLTDLGQEAVLEGDSLFERALVAVIKLMTPDDMRAMKRSSQTMLDVFSRLADKRSDAG